jgi:hypothetical protein
MRPLLKGVMPDDSAILRTNVTQPRFDGSGVLHDIKLERRKTMPNELEKRFTYHSPKADQPPRYEAIRAKGKELAELINNSCPDSREKSVAFTKLDEVVMWANAAIARNE